MLWEAMTMTAMMCEMEGPLAPPFLSDVIRNDSSLTQ